MENLDLLAPSQNHSGLDQVIVYKCNLIIIFSQNLKAERLKKKFSQVQGLREKKSALID